jgi:hypothetical protein
MTCSLKIGSQPQPCGINRHEKNGWWVNTTQSSRWKNTNLHEVAPVILTSCKESLVFEVKKKGNRVF